MCITTAISARVVSIAIAVASYDAAIRTAALKSRCDRTQQNRVIEQQVLVETRRTPKLMTILAKGEYLRITRRYRSRDIHRETHFMASRDAPMARHAPLIRSNQLLRSGNIVALFNVRGQFGEPQWGGSAGLIVGGSCREIREKEKMRRRTGKKNRHEFSFPGFV
jgi:hypothetical protein